MRSHAYAEARAERGRTVLYRLRSQPPLTLRATDRGLTLVTSAGGPLGGDETLLEVDVGSGAALRVGSAAATVALPGPHPGSSHAEVRLRVADGATLHWEPEPLVIAAGADHEVDLDVDLTGSARLTLAETLVLGRHGERPGLVRSRWRIRLDGRTLLRQDTVLGTGAPSGWDGPAVLAGHRVLAARLVVDPAQPPATTSTAPIPGVEAFDLAGPGVLWTVLGDDTVAVRRALHATACVAVP